MFYSYDILNSRSGKLSIVWLAATDRLPSIQKRNNKSIILKTVIHKTW